MSIKSHLPDQTYSLAQIKQLMQKVHTSMSTFYRLAAEQGIEKYLSDNQQRGAVWNKAQVDILVGQRIQNQKNKNKGITGEHVNERIESKSTHETSIINSSTQAATDWIRSEDLPYVFALDYELYGEEATVSPLVTKYWWQKNPYACRILFNQNNRKEVWGAFTILPMDEENIIKLLKGDLEEKDITPDMICTYEPGKEYTGYIASLALRPERKNYLFSLVTSITDYWTEHAPTFRLTKLYAFALNYSETEESDGLRIIRKLYFSPRYDIGENAWELRLDRYNPSILIQQFQKQMREQQARKKISTTTQISDNHLINQQEVDTTTFRPAQTREDFSAIVEVEGEIFNSKTDNDEYYADLWYSWHLKNPEMFYVLEKQGRIIGFVSMLPLPSKKIERILQEQESPSSIAVEDIQIYQPQASYDTYVHVMGVRPEFGTLLKRTYGMRMLTGLSKFLVDLGKQGVEIRNIFARSRMEDGIRLSEKIGFRELTAPTGSNKHLYQLEVDCRSDVVFLDEYKEALLEWRKKHPGD